MRRPFQILIAILLAGLVSAPVASWAGSEWHGDKRAQKVSAQDRRFARQAARANLLEIKSSLLALRRSKDRHVRAFARRLIADHSRQGAELARIAQAKGIDLPEAPSRAQRAVIRRLASLKCSRFDCAYLSAQVAAHRQAIALFEREVNEGRNRKLRAFAERGLPVLRMHLHLAGELRGEKGCGMKAA